MTPKTGRLVLASYEGHHDEGLGSQDLRPCGDRYFLRMCSTNMGPCSKKLGVDLDNGLGDLYAKIKTLPDDQRTAIEDDIQAVYKKRPPLAMVNSDKGITNLHVPSDIIIDASMPPVIRDSGRCGILKASCKTPKRSFPTPVTPRCIMRSSSSVRSMAPLILRPWEAFPTWVSWRRQRRNTDRTTRLSKLPATAPFV